MLTAVSWGASLVPPLCPRRSRLLCADGRVKGAKLLGGVWILSRSVMDPRLPHGRPRKKVKPESVKPE